MKEIRSRLGPVVVITNNKSDRGLDEANHVIFYDADSELFSVFAATIAGQMIAYYTADYLGKDVDQPRNLAKSVTVE